MLNGHARRIIRGNECQVLCDAIVDLISKAQRPYLFKVTVTGKPPHVCTRVYEIAAKSDNVAAMTGIDRFVKEMAHPLSIFGAMT
jgi:hypothetical protein